MELPNRLLQKSDHKCGYKREAQFNVTMDSRLPEELPHQTVGRAKAMKRAITATTKNTIVYSTGTHCYPD